jgi:hypothetical protein
VNCEDAAGQKALNSTATEAQGEHEVAGEGDLKHIESDAAGTEDSGSFRFRLYNRSDTITGTTQFTAFFDRDDDDRFCSAEPSGNGSIGWASDPAAPSGLPSETATCPEPMATPTSSPSPSPTPTRTATASPTPTSTVGASRTVTLSASEANVDAGDQVTLNGQVFSSNASCEDTEFVRIRRRVHGTDAFADFSSTTTNADGFYELEITANSSADYMAVAPAHDSCAEGTSQAVTVLAKVKVSISVRDFSPERGAAVVFKGRVTPNHSGTKVVLQRKKGGRWVKVARDALNGKSRYRIEIDADWKRARRFRVKWAEADSDHESGISQVVKVTTHR